MPDEPGQITPSAEGSDGAAAAGVEAGQEAAEATVLSGQESASPAAGAPAATGEAATPPADGAAFDWRVHIPEDLKTNPTLANVKVDGVEGVQQLMRQLVHAQSLIGRDRIPAPPADAEFGSDAVRDTYRALGTPENVQGYTGPEIPADAAFRPEAQQVADFHAKALELHLNPAQVKGLQAWFVGDGEAAVKTAMETSSRVHAEQVAQIKARWGSAFEQKQALVRATRDWMDGEREDGDKSPTLRDILQSVDVHGVKLGDHPVVVRAFERVSTLLSEDALRGGSKGESAFGIAPTDAERRIAEHKADPEFMKRYQLSHIPGHKEAVEEMTALFKQAHPEDKQPQILAGMVMPPG